MLVFTKLEILLLFLFNFNYSPLSSNSNNSSFNSNSNVDSSSCALLYRQNVNLSNIVIYNNQHVSNVEESFESPHQLHHQQPKWEPISSIIIKPGCSLTGCNGTDFNGLCKTFTNNFKSLPDGFDDIRSTSCTCDKECNCSDVFIRRTGCGRAYINKDCNKCHAYYLDLKGSHETVPQEFKNNISSIIVRPGCKLTIYDQEDFDGESTELEGVTIENWTGGTLGSYDCKCPAGDVTQPLRNSRPPSASFPNSIQIPSSLNEIVKLTNIHGRHPGLIASLKSLENKRSPKNVYILVLGLTGAGKSSAINLLFDNPNLTRIGHSDSTTKTINEFTIPLPIDHLGISNSKLHVIDTPGLGDTRGLVYDAQFLASLDEYLAKHQDLSNRLPNIVLIFGKYDDNRYSGIGAAFVKMLNALDLFRSRLTDKHFSNVIFVLSHYMSYISDNAKRSPSFRIRSFKRVIEARTLFPRPISIVIAENEAAQYGLPMLNGYYRLPNGDFYPRNLFDKIQYTLTNCEDPIGEAIIRTAFHKQDDFNITSTQFGMIGITHAKTTKYLNKLSDSGFQVNKTEVSELLAAAYNGLSIDLKLNFPDCLSYTQWAFNIRRLYRKVDLPTTSLEIIRLFKELKQNEAINYLIRTGLGLNPILLENLITGYSYNLLEDKPLSISPFKTDKNLRMSDSGYMFPNGISCGAVQETVGIFRTYPSVMEYAKDRLRSLNVDGCIPLERFTGIPIPGCNILDSSLSSAASSNTGFKLNALREYRTFELTLNHQLLHFTPEFINTVKALPSYNESDFDCVQIWRSFFNIYGTHVVSSSHAGGSIEIQLTSQQTQALEPNIAEEMFNFIQFAEDVTVGTLIGNTSTKNSMSFSANSGIRHVLKFKGGDLKYHTADLTNMNLDAAVQLLENWKESLSLIPGMLTSDLKLLPISQVAEKINPNISIEMEKVVALFFNSSIRYTPIPTIEKSEILDPVPPPPSDTETKDPFEYVAQSNDFNSFLQIMKDIKQKGDERYAAAVLELQKEAVAEENKGGGASSKKTFLEKSRVLLQLHMRETLENGKKFELERIKLQELFEIEKARLRAEQEALGLDEFELDELERQERLKAEESEGDNPTYQYQPNLHELNGFTCFPKESTICRKFLNSHKTL